MYCFVECADVLKNSGVAEYVHCGIIVHNIIRRGDGVVVLMEDFGAPPTRGTPVRLRLCGEVGFHVSLGGSFGFCC